MCKEDISSLSSTSSSSISCHWATHIFVYLQSQLIHLLSEGPQQEDASIAFCTFASIIFDHCADLLSNTKHNEYALFTTSVFSLLPWSIIGLGKLEAKILPPQSFEHLTLSSINLLSVLSRFAGKAFVARSKLRQLKKHGYILYARPPSLDKKETDKKEVSTNNNNSKDKDGQRKRKTTLHPFAKEVFTAIFYEFASISVLPTSGISLVRESSVPLVDVHALPIPPPFPRLVTQGVNVPLPTSLSFARSSSLGSNTESASSSSPMILMSQSDYVRFLRALTPYTDSLRRTPSNARENVAARQALSTFGISATDLSAFQQEQDSQSADEKSSSDKERDRKRPDKKQRKRFAKQRPEINKTSLEPLYLDLDGFLRHMANFHSETIWEELSMLEHHPFSRLESHSLAKLLGDLRFALKPLFNDLFSTGDSLPVKFKDVISKLLESLESEHLQSRFASHSKFLAKFSSSEQKELVQFKNDDDVTPEQLGDRLSAFFCHCLDELGGSKVAHLTGTCHLEAQWAC
jgi:hypothetical protein